MVFQYPVEKIILSFDKYQLVDILIILKKFQNEFSVSGKYTEWRKTDFQSINNSFSDLFGKQTDLKTDDSGTVSYIWQGNKVILVSIYKFLGSKEGDQQIISVRSISSLVKSSKGGF